MLFFNQKWQKCQSDTLLHLCIKGNALKTILNAFFNPPRTGLDIGPDFVSAFQILCWFQKRGISFCLVFRISCFHQIYKINFFMPYLTMKWTNFSKNSLLNVHSLRANEMNHSQDRKCAAGMVYMLSKTLHDPKIKLCHSWTETSLS